MTDAPPRRRLRIVVLGALLCATAVAAWRLRFLCDDAFITFRYVSHAHDGLGLVWNPPPFRPVEGYTSFSWALLLWATWSWFGVEPPDAANILSIGCGLLLFAVCAVAALRLRDRFGNRLPDGIGLLAMAALAANRNFLQWMTGGLETAMFNLCFVGWVLLAFHAHERRGTRWWLWWSGAAMLAALTRPDGLLLVAATAAAALWLVVARRLAPGRAALGLLPLLLVGAHVLWRRSFYGEWLPNTYYAKTTAPWPEAGWRYLYCFAFEHGAWLWPLVALAALVAAFARRSISLRALLTDHVPATAAVCATLFHVGYYVLRVGGDHFEYRVLSHTIPLGVLATAAMAARIRSGSLAPILALLLLALAQSVAWVHLARLPIVRVPDFAALGDSLPAWARPLVREYDRCQAWLQLQFDCYRVEAHAVSLADLRQNLPPRTRLQTDPNDVPVMGGVAVGVLGWVLPDVAILDVLGLNDWVAARTPTREWSATFLPPAVLEATLANADTDHDAVVTRSELEAAFAAIPGSSIASARPFVNVLLVLFARARDDALLPDDIAELHHFFAHLRFIAHERSAPPDYVYAFEPNVVLQDRHPVVTPRPNPLTAERVRQIETEWRRRTRDAASGG